MKYTIISLNDERIAFKKNIRQSIGHMLEVKMPAVDGKNVDLPKEMSNRWLMLHSDTWPNPKLGELGVWLSNYDRWELAASMNEPLIVFEDDAIIDGTFREKLDRFVKDLPDDWDFAALWVPENQRADYNYNTVWIRWKPHTYGFLPDHLSRYRLPGTDLVTRVYQGYGMVSLMYSPKGARRLVELAKQYGITGPVDCWIFEMAHMGLLKGYAPHPDFADIVTYDWSAVSHAQLTERFL